MTLADLGTHDGTLEAAIVCLIIAALVGGVVFAILEYGFKVAWSRTVGALVFLVVLALCLL